MIETPAIKMDPRVAAHIDHVTIPEIQHIIETTETDLLVPRGNLNDTETIRLKEEVSLHQEIPRGLNLEERLHKQHVKKDVKFAQTPTTTPTNKQRCCSKYWID